MLVQSISTATIYIRLSNNNGMASHLQQRAEGTERRNTGTKGARMLQVQIESLPSGATMQPVAASAAA